MIVVSVLNGLKRLSNNKDTVSAACRLHLSDDFLIIMLSMSTVTHNGVFKR